MSSKEDIKRQMQKNIRGELKFSAYNFLFSKNYWNEDSKKYFYSNNIGIDKDLLNEQIDHILLQVYKTSI